MRACVHIFGNSPSPAVSNFGLKSTVRTVPPPSDEARVIIEKNFYVDDSFIASDTPSEALKVYSEVRGYCRNLILSFTRLFPILKSSWSQFLIQIGQLPPK